jgi:hypothetical protein
MSTYRINQICGSNGYKVNVMDDAGSLRVVGVFFTENAARAWIMADRRAPEPARPCSTEERAP